MDMETVGAENKTKTVPFQVAGTVGLYRFAFLSVIVLVSPLVFSQPVTGSFVNAALFLSAVFFGFRRESVAIATVPSLVAVATGQLPVVLAPIVPFIMAGNLLLVFLADRGLRKSVPFFPTAILAATVKATFLFCVASVFGLTLFRDMPIAEKIPMMFGGLQFATALAGAVIAFFVLRVLPTVSERD